MRRRAATMQDIADQVGVSRMAVSVALHGTSSNVRVSDGTRARILEVARVLEYRPNAIARSLKRKQTDLIGLYSGYGPLDPRNYFLSQIVAGIQEGCLPFGKDLLIHTTFGGQSTDEIYAELLDGRIDGLILFSPPEDPLAARLADSPLPVISVADAIPSLPSVVVDDAQAARLTFDYLAGKGHRRFAYRSFDRHLVSAERRAEAFITEARKRGLEIEEWRTPERREDTDPHLADLRAASPGSRPTAVICWNDLSAYDLLFHCRQSGMQVPDDLAVVGFDGGDSNPLEYLFRLTTVRAPWEQVARTATRLLVSRLEGEDVPRQAVLPVELIRGDSA